MPTRKPKRTNWKQQCLTLRGQVAKAWEAKAAETQTLRRTVAELELFRQRAESAERRNAELLREREAVQKRHCAICYPVYCDGRCEIVRFWKCKPKSWLRRNWVGLTVMAVVLGAIGFIVWRAWR